MERIAYAEQFRKAVQYFATTLPEEKALVVSSIFDEWAVNVKYVTGEWVAYGVNAKKVSQSRLACGSVFL